MSDFVKIDRAEVPAPPPRSPFMQAMMAGDTLWIGNLSSSYYGYGSRLAKAGFTLHGRRFVRDGIRGTAWWAEPIETVE